MRKLSIIPILLALVIAGCASRELPEGYESLREEVTILEISRYHAAVREAYRSARQSDVMPADVFLVAVKVDQTFVAAWNAFLDAKEAGSDTAELWSTAISNLGMLEGIVRLWAPIPEEKPEILGGIE